MHRSGWTTPKILGQDRVVERQRADASQAHAAGSLIADAIGIGTVACNRTVPEYQRAVIGGDTPAEALGDVAAESAVGDGEPAVEDVNATTVRKRGIIDDGAARDCALVEAVR